VPCRAPAIRGKQVCRLHGGKGGGPKGKGNGAYRTGRYTAEANADRREQRTLIRNLRRFMAEADEPFPSRKKRFRGREQKSY
jgi:hypothetical protein